VQHVLIAATRFEWAQLAAAVFAVVAALAIPVTAYLRRPSVSLVEDTEKVYPRLEVDQPFVRLLVRAKRRRRAAHGTRVEVIGVRRLDETKLTPLGHWPLGWTSAEPVAVTVYAGAERAVDFAVLERYDPEAAPYIYGGDELLDVLAPDRWHLALALHGDYAPTDQRHRLAPGSWAVRLVVGTDDGDARRYEVHVRWDGGEADPQSALDAVLDRLAVVEL
jgi:hypothetical protein